MADPIPQQTGVPDTTSSTLTVVSTDTQDSDIPTVRLKLRKPKNDKKVQWTTETVDNEDMNKKKSKCCCIYNKPRKFDESSSEEDSDEECDHCQGHVEKKKHKKTNNESLSCNVIAESVTTTTTENEIETIIPVPESLITN